MPLTELAVSFVGSFPDPQQPLDPALPEIAILGRSNVGKSSLINAVVGRRIARTSGTPGKTQHLNAFQFPTFYLIDLPGYGYARLPHGERKRLRALVDGVIGKRPRLRGVVWLLDIRHPPSKEDFTMRDLLADAGRETVVVLTKADKLPRARRAAAIRDRSAELEVAVDDIVVTSSAEGTGISDLGELILEIAAG